MDGNSQRTGSPAQSERSSTKSPAKALMTAGASNGFLLTCLVACWYFSSYFFNVYLKLWFANFSAVSLFPLLLMVFFVNMAATAGWTAYEARMEGYKLGGMRLIGALILANQADVSLLCASGVVGMVAGCLVMQHGSIQLVQIARSVGPLCTACWAYLMLNQVTSGVPLICLLLTLVGTALASWNEPSYSSLTLCLMTIINTSLSFRNAATKHLIKQFPTLSATLVSSALLTLTNVAGFCCIAILWTGSLLLQPQNVAAYQLPSSAFAIRLIITVGACNFAYNLSSQLVLARIPVVSHGMLELFKRVFVVVAAFLLIPTKAWALQNVFGAVLATISTVLYFYSKHKPLVDEEQQQLKQLHDLHRFDSFDEGPYKSPNNSGSPIHPTQLPVQLFSSGHSGEIKTDRVFSVSDLRPTPPVKGLTRLQYARGIMLLIILSTPFAFLQSAGIHYFPWMPDARIPSQDPAATDYSGDRTEAVFRAGIYQTDFTPYHRHLPRLAGNSKECSSFQATGQAARFIGVWSGWIGRNNLGDEIVHDLFLDLLVAALMEHTSSSSTVTVSRKDPHLHGLQPSCSFDDLRGCDFGVIGGGSTVYVDYIKRISSVVLNPKATVALFGSGFQSGLLSKSVTPRYLNLLCNRSLIGGVRGPVTSHYLEQYGRRDINIIRDSAILSDLLYYGGRNALSKQLDELDVRGPAFELRMGGENTSGLDSSAATPRQLIVLTSKQKYAAVFRAAAIMLLERTNCVIVLQAVDDAGGEEHRQLAEEINRILPKGAPPVMLHNENQDYAAVLDLYRRSSGSINARLHSGVLALASLKPSVYLASNVKYSDLMQSLGLEHLLMNPKSPELSGLDPANLAEALVSKLLQALSNRSSTEETLSQSRDEALVAYKILMTPREEKSISEEATNPHMLYVCREIFCARYNIKIQKDIKPSSAAGTFM